MYGGAPTATITPKSRQEAVEGTRFIKPKFVFILVN